MSETTYYQRNREVILNRAKDYCENNKELLREREQKINTENYLKRKKIEKVKRISKNYRETKEHASHIKRITWCFNI